MPYWFGSPELAAEVAPFRYALLLLALAWALAAARAPRLVAALFGVLFVVAATGFWVLSLGRPYGLLEDAAATRRAAEASVAAASGRAEESFVAGEPTAQRVFVALLTAGFPARALVALPSLLPAFTLAAIGLLVLALWARRQDALAGACLWLAFATGSLESARGLGLAPGIWRRPESALALPFVVAVALTAARLPGRAGAGLASLVALVTLALPSSEGTADVGDALAALSLDQLPWLALGSWGISRTRDGASLGLCLGGGAGLLLGSVLATGDAWASHALFRLGLLLGSAAAAPPLLGAAADAAQRLAPGRSGLARERLGLALVIALGAPCSFLAWWDPVRTDPVARASQEPISPVMAPLMSFIRDGTPREAVFLASADYAPAVAVFGGRRVLRAPSVLVTADDVRRVRAEGAILAGRPAPPGGLDYGVRFVLLAPGDFKARGIQGPEDLERMAGFRMRYADAAGYRVYEVVR